MAGVNDVPPDIYLHDDLFLLIASFLPSFLHACIQQSKAACTTEQIQARVQASKFRVYSRGSALLNITNYFQNQVQYGGIIPYHVVPFENVPVSDLHHPPDFPQQNKPIQADHLGAATSIRTPCDRVFDMAMATNHSSKDQVLAVTMLRCMSPRPRCPQLTRNQSQTLHIWHIYNTYIDP